MSNQKKLKPYPVDFAKGKMWYLMGGYDECNTLINRIIMWSESLDEPFQDHRFSHSDLWPIDKYDHVFIISAGMSDEFARAHLDDVPFTIISPDEIMESTESQRALDGSDWKSLKTIELELIRQHRAGKIELSDEAITFFVKRRKQREMANAELNG